MEAIHLMTGKYLKASGALMNFLLNMAISGLFTASSFAEGLPEPPALSTIDISRLDASFESQALDAWLTETLGKDWTITTNPALTDCGEQDGSGTQTDFPICLEVIISRASTKGILEISVGTYRKGINGDPVFYFGTIDGRFFDKLSTLHSKTSL